MNKLKLFLYFFLILLNQGTLTHVNALEIDEKSTNIDILSHAYLYLDETNMLSKEQVQIKDFTKNSEDILGLGFVPNVALWIRVRLTNISDKSLSKIIEYDNPEAEELLFFDEKKVSQEGMFHIDKSRLGLHPSLRITLEPYQEKTYYIKAHSKITSLVAKLVLYNVEDFIQRDMAHKNILLIFFAAIFILLIYNLMLFIFTKDRAYLYYILYLSGIILFQAMNSGVAQYYIFSSELSIVLTKASMAISSFLSITIILFTREFLHTKRFKKIDIFLKVYLYMLPILSVLSFDNYLFDMNIIVLLFPLIGSIGIGIYAWMQGEKQAKYYVLGWSIVQISLILILLKYLSVYDVTQSFKYIIEVAFVFEALLFSIALAHRIKIISEQKSIADKKLILFQREEKQRLQKLVNEKTEDLQLALDEKNVLYKELNHRVKNNLQMILSLVKLQIFRATTDEVKEQLVSTKNRINSIAHLYEILNLQKNSIQVDTKEYFRNIVKTVAVHFDKEVSINYDIHYNLTVQELIYCGLILNELITNSYKYAFTSSGNIMISLEKEEQFITMCIEDDGSGFIKKDRHSLGLEIVETLVKKQLQGNLDLHVNSGTKVIIKWEENV